MPAEIEAVSWQGPDKSPDTEPEKIVSIVPKESIDSEEVMSSVEAWGAAETVEEHEDEIEVNIEDVSVGSLGDLIVLLKKKYGNTFIKWEPETLFTVLEDDTGGPVAREDRERILASRAFAVDGPWKEWELFEKAAIAATGGSAVLDTIQYISPEDMARTLSLMKKINPNGAFSDEVYRYIAARLYNDQIMWVGDIFPIECQKYLHELGAPKALAAACKERFKELSGIPLEEVAPAETLVDMQVGRILGLRYISEHD